MASRAQVLSDNTTSFPNNNSGAITPATLRDFNATFINSVRFTDETVVNATSASYATYAANAGLLNGSSSGAFVNDTTFTSTSASLSSRIANQEAFSSSLDATFATDAQLTSLSASVASTYVANAVTSSMTVLSSSFATTASYALNVSTVDTGSLLTTASFNNGTRNLTFTKGNGTTFAVNIPDASGSAAIPTGSLLVTASAANNVITFTKGDASTFNVTVATGSINTSVFATTGSNTFNGSQVITGSVNITSGGLTVDSATGVTADYINSLTGDLYLAPIAPIGKVITNGNIEVTGGNSILVDSILPSNIVNDNITLTVGNFYINSDTVITGSVRGNVTTLSVSSNTASMDCGVSNFFTLQLVSGSDVYINPSNILPGQTINLLLNTTGSGTVSFPSSVKQISGSAYIPTTSTSKDIVTFVSFDNSNLYLASVKNLI